jgi:hypothetical protein
MTPLILKRASASRSSGEWNDDDYDPCAWGGHRQSGAWRSMRLRSAIGVPNLAWCKDAITAFPFI